MALFVRAANPIWFFVDLEGLPLNDEYYIFFLTNTLPYIPQTVTHDPEGLVPWSFPIRFYPNGTLPDNIYFNPELVYRIEIRHGNSQSDPLIYEVNNFVPENGSEINQNDLSSGDNQITNPQFESINFLSPLTYTQVVSDTYLVNVAPGWTLKLIGEGTTVLTQLDLAGTDDIAGNPPFALRINNNGWTEVSLYQRFEENGAIFANGAIAMTVTARASGSTEDITLTYSPSSPGTPVEILSATIAIGAFQVLKGAVDLPASTNNNTGNNSYVDIIIQLEGTGIVDLTNIQLIGQSVALPTDFDIDTDSPLFKEETIERQIDNQFHYYASNLITKPKNSILTGWNFALNPFQFYPTALTTASSQTQYITDQTIIHQEAASRVQTGQSLAINRYTLEIKSINGANNNRFALIQYVDPSTIRPYWNYILSSLARMRIFTSHGTSVRIKMRLISSDSLPEVVSPTQPISSWPSNSDPIFDVQWTVIEPLNDPAYVLLNAYDTSEGEEAFPAFSYNNFPMPPCNTQTATLGIVIYTMDNMNNSLGTEDSICFDRISLTENEFAVDTDPQTFDESLRECQYYWEQSYAIGVLPGASTFENANFSEQLEDGSSPINLIARSFNLQYNTIKRIVLPTVTIYSVDGTINSASAFISNNAAPDSPSDVAISSWTANISSKATFFRASNITPIYSLVQSATFPEAYILYHYTIDARLGV